MASACAVRTIKEREYTSLAEPLPHEPTLMTQELHDMLAAIAASPSPRLPAVGDAMTYNGVSTCRHCGCLYVEEHL